MNKLRNVINEAEDTDYRDTPEYKEHFRQVVEDPVPVRVLHIPGETEEERKARMAEYDRLLKETK